jgi:16S rRNA (uracil1498-N3)-methyltransferase
MRAHWVLDLEKKSHYLISGGGFHHLVHVTRLEEGEELLLLDGRGKRILTKVESISKRELKLLFLDEANGERRYEYDLALGIPKKEALELSLKEATELGFRRIYLIRSDYSQTRVPDKERLHGLLVSALEQSNALYLPELVETDWKGLPWENYQEILLMDSQREKSQNMNSQNTGVKLLVVGPEGGFSPEERSFFESKNDISAVNLPTPILRTPTAVAAGAGLLLQSLLK